MKTKKIDLIFILVLVCFMPFHSIFFAVTGLDSLVMWRDVLVILALIIVAFVNSFRIRLSAEGIIIAIAISICSLHAFGFHSSSMSVGIWGNSLRIYLEAFLVYYIGRSCSADEEFYKYIKKVYVKTAVLISVWGIFQMFVLGQNFLHAIGYGISSANLANGFQRNVGVFSSANLMGVYLVIALILLLYGDVKIKFKKICMFFLLISLVLTFSTSAILGLVCCVFYQYLNKIGLRHFVKLHHNVLKLLGGITVTVILAILLDTILLGGKVTDMIFERVDELTMALTFSSKARSTSASIHLDDLIRATDIVKDNFWGVGFSTSTFILLNRVPRSMMTNTVESSLFTVLFDFGVLAGIIYFLPFIYPIFKEFRSKRTISIVSDKIMIALLILYIFLPLVSSIELRFYAFLFLGLESNRKLNKGCITPGGLLPNV